jgi:hypothetical protein
VYEVNAKSARVDIRRMQQLLGSGSTLLFRKGSYRHNFDGGIVEFDLYNRRDNRMYAKRRGNDTIYLYDCSKGGKPIRDLKTSTQKKKILDMSCNQLTVQYPDHTKVEYYNSDSIAVDPQWFAEFRRDDQYKVDAIERSILLRSELDYPAVRIIAEATEIQRQAVDTVAFEVPANAILLKKE